MNEKLSTEIGTNKLSNKTVIIVILFLCVSLSLAFAVGFILGRQDNPPPIIIKTATG